MPHGIGKIKSFDGTFEYEGEFYYGRIHGKGYIKP